MHVQLLGNCSIKRVWCISHRDSVCTEAWEVKANRVHLPFHIPYSMPSATGLASACQHLPQGKVCEKMDKGGDHICTPALFPCCHIFGHKSALKAQGKLSLIRRILTTSKPCTWFPVCTRDLYFVTERGLVTWAKCLGEDHPKVCREPPG